MRWALLIFRLMEKVHHVLIIGFVWPEPKSSAAGKRMMELIHLFQDQGWQVTVASSAAATDHMADLEKLGVQTMPIEINSSSFDVFVKELQPSIVLFDRFVTEEQFGWRVAEHCPDAIRILDTEDLHCLRRSRKKALHNGHTFNKSDLLKVEDAKREIASIYRCDLTLMISEFEMDLLQDVFDVDATLLQYLPFLLDPVDGRTRKKWPDFEDRNHFMTIGNFRHDPNADSVEYIYQQIWPLIRQQLPGADFYVYGAYPNQRVEQLHNPEDGFHIMGRASSAKAVVQKAKVCLAPLRFGAGLKGKLIEAMQCGTPSVTTPIGAEGINGTLPWCGEIAVNSKEIADRAVQLFSDKALWRQAQQHGADIINKRFAQPKYGAAFLSSIKNISKQLKEHRLNNFTGQMLMHHRSASSKYMGRWIEAKNN